MTTDTDKIEELVSWLLCLNCWNASDKTYAEYKEYVDFLRSLSAKLIELRAMFDAAPHIETEAEKKAKGWLEDGSAGLEYAEEIIRALLLERGSK